MLQKALFPILVAREAVSRVLRAYDRHKAKLVDQAILELREETQFAKDLKIARAEQQESQRRDGSDTSSSWP